MKIVIEIQKKFYIQNQSVRQYYVFFKYQIGYYIIINE